MNNIRKYTAWLGAGAVIMTLATGCPAPVESTENVVGAAGATTANVADAAADSTSNMAAAAGNNLDAAGTAVANGAMAAGNAVAGAGDAAIFTPKIKTALGANKAMEGSKINVDTMAAEKTVSLTGTVKSSAQKTMAEAMAKKEIPADYKIDNKLTMEGKM